LTYNRIIFVLFLAIAVSCKNDSEKIRPEVTSLTEAVYASLTVQPADNYYVYSAVGGIVKSNLVTEGQLVEKGQVLMQIDNTNPKLNMENARLAFELAKENYTGSKTILNELENQINTAQLQLKNDSVNYLRQKRLHEQGIGSENEFDNRKLAYEVSKKNLALLKSRYEQTRNQLETQFKQAENNYKTSLKTASDYSITSQIQGKVYEILKDPGEIVLLQEPVAMIGSADLFHVEMLVDEVDITRVKEGQKVLVRMDAYGDKVFEAYVSKIYPKMDSRSQTFRVDAEFENQPQKLYPGLTGEANIIIDQKEGVLTIPYEYLMEDNQVKTDQGMVDVEVGIKNFERVEILSGIDSLTYIYKPG
jgi:multidrug efflux pump subunit AcrA (membrane-fusion protein)